LKISQIKTVWVETKGTHQKPSFAISGEEARDYDGETLFVTNDLKAFDGFFAHGSEAAVDMLELCRMAGLCGIDGTLAELLHSEDPPAIAFEQLWSRVESSFLLFPIWALDLLRSISENLEEHALTRLYTHFAGRVRAGAKGGGSWHESFKVRNSYPQKKFLPRHDECEQLDIDKLAAHLEPGGSFQRQLKGYESRSGQVKMLRYVAEAFNKRGHLAVEAGTGVGKSIAYLLPAAAWSKLNGTPVIISTNTRNLQSQLMEKDLPLVKRIVDCEYGDEGQSLKIALLKGRANYLCLRQFGTLIDYSMFELERPELRHLAGAVTWALRSDDGDLDSFAGSGLINAAFLANLATSGEECGGRGCRYYKRCFMQQARQRALDADIVVANHALVFSEAQSGGAILPPCGQIIFDEAHNLEEVATRHLSVEISSLRLMAVLKRISRGRDGHRRGVIETLQRHLEKGAVGDDKEMLSFLQQKTDAVRSLTDRIRRVGARFFESASALACESGQVRMRCIADGADAQPVVASFGANTPLHQLKRQLFRNGAFVDTPVEHDEEHLRYSKDALKQHLAEAATHMQEMAQKLRSAMADELAMFNDQALGLESCAARLREFVADLDFVIAATEPEYVFWVEHSSGGHKRVSLFGAPLSIAGTLNDALYKNRDSCIFCSATLRVSASFGYINRRLGFDLIEPERFQAVVAESPFDYLRQCAVYAAEFMPDPAGVGSLNYVDTLSSMMLELFVVTGGRALALFTSYEMMNRVADLLEEPLREAGIKLLVHGRSGTRDYITQVFRGGQKCALMGTHSFWEGVDVSGEALSCVVMARLPFAAVGDPIVEARCEQIQLAGGNSFREFSLPQAVIRFRQGFGRLIRTEEDRGIVVVADPRIVSKRYGSSFVKSLPCPVLKTRSPKELLHGVEAFFSARL